jgi:hypothetical protein
MQIVPGPCRGSSAGAVSPEASAATAAIAIVINRILAIVRPLLDP